MHGDILSPVSTTLFPPLRLARPLPRLHLIIAECAAEVVPEPLWSHPSVSKNAKTRGKRPGQLLLDDTLHHSAMRQAANQGRFTEPERRGRPDILHASLLVALESRLNKEDRLRTWVHTRHDELVTLVPELRVQRAQHRFYGLLEQLFEHGAVPPDGRKDLLMSLERDVTLADAIIRTGAQTVFVMDESGQDEPLEPLFQPVTQGPDAAEATDVAVVVGGFAQGALESDLSRVEHRRIALGGEPLTAWSVIADVVTRYRMATNGT